MHFQIQDLNVQIQDLDVQIVGLPNSGFGRPNVGIGRPGFGRPNPGFGRPNPGFGCPNPGFGHPNPVQTLDLDIQVLIWTSNSWILGIQIPETLPQFLWGMQRHTQYCVCSLSFLLYNKSKLSIMEA